MFENLLAQDGIRDALQREIGADTVPPAMLFSGPPASGKLTAALECARLLSCTGDGSWNCRCPDCLRHRALVHPDMLLLGRRTFPEEIAVAKDLLLRVPGQGSAYFFIRAVRKLTNRFHPVLWAGEESRLSKAVPSLQSIEESLALFDPDALEKLEPETLAKTAESLAADCAVLETFAPDAPAVFMVRNLEIWSRNAPLGKRKCIILENADRMQDSARNAMLKILEEPPETVRFILLTSRRASMMATILSRARMYSFVPRDASSTRMILSRVFKAQGESPSIQAYMDERTAFPSGLARKHAENLVGALVSSSGPNSAPGSYGDTLAKSADTSGKTIQEIIDEVAAATGNFGTKDKTFSGSFPAFAKALLAVFSELLRESGDNPAWVSRIDEWSGKTREAVIQNTLLNRNPELLARTLAASMGERA
jgi:DNA polymerase-3 subunit gamma/tau